MEQKENAIVRVGRWEQVYDQLREAAKQAPASVHRDETLREFLQQLTEYYEGGQWREDYMQDARGLLPPTMKKGVLSKDGVRDLLSLLKEHE